MIILGIISFHIICIIFFYIIEKKMIYNKFKILIEIEISKRLKPLKPLIKTKTKSKIMNKKINEKGEKSKNNNLKKINNKRKEKNKAHVPPKNRKILFGNLNGIKNKNRINIVNRNKKISVLNGQTSKNVLKSKSLLKTKNMIKKKKMGKSKVNIFKRMKNVLIKKTKNKIIHDKYHKYRQKTYNELNNMSYNDAIAKDKRTIFQYYFSLIMTKQILFFTFNCKIDYNSKIIKICFLLQIYTIFLLISSLFINEETIHDLYISKGNIEIFYHHIYTILYIILISSSIKNILMRIIFTEIDFLSIREIDGGERKSKIHNVLSIISVKFCLFFIYSILSLILIWIYIFCLFTIFKNTQFFAIKISLISLGISLFFPIIFGLIPAILRKCSLGSREKKDRIFIFLLSKIVQTFL